MFGLASVFGTNAKPESAAKYNFDNRQVVHLGDNPKINDDLEHKVRFSPQFPLKFGIV